MPAQRQSGRKSHISSRGVFGPVWNLFLRFGLNRVRKETWSAFLVGIIIGTVLTQVVVLRFMRSSTPTSNNESKFATSQVIPEDRCGEKGNRCYSFVFGTGRSGTKHLERMLISRSSPATSAFITHELEHQTVKTKLIVSRQYRKLAALRTRADFKSATTQYVTRTKIPFYNLLLQQNKASRFVYTGHLPMVFGLGPALVENLPLGSVRIVRMRRERLATAASLMALGPEEEDPWGATEQRDTNGRLKEAPTENRRWFPTPFDAMVRLRIHPTTWAELNRFQRWLWYVDDVECRWQALRHNYEGRFSWMEDSLENVAVFDNGTGWRRIAEFMGVDLNFTAAQERSNSIEWKNRKKESVPEATLRRWDEEYRKLVGECHVDNTVSYGWYS